MLKVAIFVVLLTLAGVSSYCLWVVSTAREYTLSTVLPEVRERSYALSPWDLTPRQTDILLKVEDPNFFGHGGVDFLTPGGGITTITQSLVKGLYFDAFKPGVAKLKQTVIAAFVLDPLMSKEEQLRLFLNTVYLGNQAWGFAQASKVYFGKSFSELEEEEYMALVAMIIAPAVFDLRAHPDRNAERVARIKRLVAGEYVPRGVCDLYYGKIAPEAQEDLPPFSYFSGYYE